MLDDVFTPESWNMALNVLVRAGIAVTLGGIIGWEREIHGKPSGVRTHMLVALGALMFTEVGRSFGGDPGRVAAQVVTGIGFLGAGTILRTGVEVQGLTTAASVWATAAIAMGVARGGPWLLIAVIATVLALITLALVDDLVRRFVKSPRIRKLEVVLHDRGAVHDLLEALTKQQMSVRSVQVIESEPNVVLVLDIEGRETEILEGLCLLPRVKSAQWSN